MKTNAKQSNMLPELVGFEPMGIAETEKVLGGQDGNGGTDVVVKVKVKIKIKKK